MNRDLKDIVKLGTLVITFGVITCKLPNIDFTIYPKVTSEINTPISLDVDRHRVDAKRDIRTTQDIVYYYLIDNGFSSLQACAIMGNIQQECSFNENLTESNGVGYGLLQWSFERRTILENKYNDPSNIYNQLDYFMWEYESQWTGNYKEIFDNSTNLEELTRAFCNGYERAGIPNMNNRIYWANHYYSQYQ